MKHTTKQWGVAIVSLLMAILFCACATSGKPAAPTGPRPFDAAVEEVTERLLSAVAEDRGGFFDVGQAEVVIEPFADPISGEVPRVSREIEQKMIQAGTARHPSFKITRLSTETLETADYLIRGAIHPDTSPSSRTPDRKRYRLRASVRNLREVRVLGTAEVPITDSDLDYAPTPAYRDNPFYLSSELGDARPAGSMDAGTGDEAVSLRLRAHLSEAESAYDEGDYTEALRLFEDALRLEGGRTLRTYAGIYMANRKLGQGPAAAAAFQEMVALSVERYNQLAVKFLFAVNSAELKPDADLEAQYDLWLRMIGRYFQETDRCLEIVGHSSRTGAEAWNRTLSLKRAENIRNMLKATFPDVQRRSRAVGMGFQENIVGIGTDDDRDALDRRVEIIPIDCRDM